MDPKQFATENARTQAAPHGLVRAGNSIEWFKCTCGEESNLLWTYKGNKSRILACSIDCAIKKARAQVKNGFMVANEPICAHGIPLDLACPHCMQELHEMVNGPKLNPRRG